MIRIDFETKSYADLKKVGAWAYSEHETTQVIVLCWAIDDGEVDHWLPSHGRAMPQVLRDAIEAGEPVEAHNVSFEISIWANVMVKRFGWVPIPNRQWRDTMAVAHYYALPGGLDKLAKVIGLPGKDPEGARLITKYSKLHLKTAKPVIPPEDMVKWIKYCTGDVVEQRVISNFLGDLPDDELEIFLLDLDIETRGLLLDHHGIARASEIVDERAATLEKEFRKITGVGPSQRDKVMAWFEEQGFPLDNLQADYLEELVEEGEIPAGPVRRALRIRLSISKASTKKLDKMVQQSGQDQVARFQCKYHGAQTGRWTGTGFQPLNMNRGVEKLDPDQLVSDIVNGSARWLDALYGDAMQAVSWATRHWIKARPGHRIQAGDYVSIEAIVLACLAGEDWKVKAFRDGVKIYEAMGDKIYNLPPGTVTKATHPLERQDGKTGELAFGYQGGLNAWLNFDDSGRHTDERIIEICKAWRKEHPNITAFWRDMGEAAIEAVEMGYETYCRDISFKVTDDWLAMRLPDGKRIWYWQPEIRIKMPSWHKPTENEDCANRTCKCKPGPQLTYMAQKFGQWKRVGTYGGKVCLGENTEVLTYGGWKRIVEVQANELVWDGQAWVSQDGCVFQGTKEVVDLCGIHITRDHLVLTKEGWVSASQSEGYLRADCGVPYGSEVLGLGQAPVSLGRQMLGVRPKDTDGRQRTEEAGGSRDQGFVRVREASIYCGSSKNARHVQAPRVCRLEVDARPLPASDTSSLGKLWRAGHNCLRKLAAVLRELLVRHGGKLGARSANRAGEQRGRILPGELPLGHARRPSTEPPHQHALGDARRKNDRGRGVAEVWGKGDDNPLPAAKRVDGPRRVYDLTNCGPHKRFVVRDGAGRPLIVHNCENATQATARQILTPAMLRLNKYGYPIVLSVYDEIVCDTPKGHGSLKEFKEIIGERVGFFREWPISVDVWEGDRYKK